MHFSNSCLSIYLKTKQKNPAKKNKQTRQNKKEKKGRREKKRPLAEFEPGTFGLTRPHIATTPRGWPHELAKSLKFNAFSMELPPANDRGKRSSHKNEAIG